MGNLIKYIKYKKCITVINKNKIMFFSFITRKDMFEFSCLYRINLAENNEKGYLYRFGKM